MGRPLSPIVILRRATRAALRRRYGYAALRIVRRAIRRALRAHHQHQLDASRPYSLDVLEIRAAYFAAMRRLRKRWPALDPTDPRAEP
jgi:hypothetical protein